MAKNNPNLTSSSKNSTPNSSSTPLIIPKKPSQSSIASIIKAYCIPATFFLLFLVFQVVLLPQSFPLSHYDVLGVQWHCSIEEVEESYENLVSKWNSGAELPTTEDFIKDPEPTLINEVVRIELVKSDRRTIRYAYELLTNPLWKRDFDLFGVDEHQDVLKNLTQLNSGREYSALELPLLDTPSMYSHDVDFNHISLEDLRSVVGNQRPWLVQRSKCMKERASTMDSSVEDMLLCSRMVVNRSRATLLGEVADSGAVELGDVDFASHLAEKKATGQPFFRNGLPSLIAFPEGCKSSNCLVRYEGERSVDAVTDWFATYILKLPRIPYYTKVSLHRGTVKLLTFAFGFQGPRFLAKSSYHKVKVMIFSDTGIRATPFVRQLAKNYQEYASFGCVLWKEEEYSFWWTAYGVESAPATVFLKDPGTKPLVYYGSPNSSWFADVMENNKLHELPQLRSVTSMKLGCDARGYSRAGSNTDIWYCVVIIGRPSPELNQMREVLRNVQQTLSAEDAANIDELAAPSAIALKDRRLTIVWMDGEVQKNLCMFYIGGEHSLDCCGPRRGIEDTPQIVMVRYMRNDSAVDDQDKKPSNSLLDVLKEDVDPVSQLVARYNGSAEPLQIMEWISKIVKDGDSTKLPFFPHLKVFANLMSQKLQWANYFWSDYFVATSYATWTEFGGGAQRASTPELVPEDSNPLWSTSNEKFISTSDGIKHTFRRIVAGGRRLSGDPRTGPILLLGALISFGGIWLRRSQPTTPRDLDETRQTYDRDDIPKEWRNRRRNSPAAEVPPSMTDFDPKGAYQMPLSGSDSE
ncbi:hypothetical protein KSS87_011679 [Heliosperma pusillum]|nr:hypothetical protein KSS87_011679 [Heliosperma pusillum]